MSVLRIRELRRAAGLTQAEFAAGVGVDRSTVAMWETENALPRTRDLPVIAHALSCSVSDLFAEDLCVVDENDGGLPPDQAVGA